MSAACSPTCAVCREVAGRTLPAGIRWLPQRHKFQARYSHKGQVYSAGVFDKQREAERALRQQQVDVRNTDVVPSRLTVGRLAAQYIDHRIAASANANTIRTYQQYAQNLNEVLGTAIVQDLTEADVETAWRALLDPTRKRPASTTGRRRKLALSAHTAQLVVSFLSTVLNWAMRRRLLVRNVATLADKPRVEPYEAAALTLPEAKALLAVLRASDDPYADVVGVTLFTLLRAESELLGASEADMDVKRGVYHFRTVLVRGQLRPAGNSKNHARAVPLPPVALYFLERHAAFKSANEATWYASQPKPLRPEARLFFRSIYGTRMSVETLRGRFHRFLEAAGIERPVRFHDLRHTGVVLLFEAGLSVPEVAAVTGHRSQVLLEVYARHMPNAASTGAAMLERMLGS